MASWSKRKGFRNLSVLINLNAFPSGSSLSHDLLLTSTNTLNLETEVSKFAYFINFLNTFLHCGSLPAFCHF